MATSCFGDVFNGLTGGQPQAEYWAQQQMQGQLQQGIPGSVLPYALGSTATITTDCTSINDTYATIAAEMKPMIGLETALAWLDRRVQEVCVQL